MKIYFLKLESKIWGKQDQELLSFVSKSRQEKIQKYLFPEDRRLSLYAALIVRMGLSQLSGIPNHQLNFVCEDLHKPLCSNLQGVDFSLSHTRNAVLCGIASNQKIGVDIEAIKKAELEIMPMVFHPAEINFMETCPLQDKDMNFFKIWTRKEAFLKMQGTGFSQDPKYYNTLQSEPGKYFISFPTDHYMRSICTENSTKIKLIALKENKIHKFFTN